MFGQSMITVTLLHKFVYEFRRNNTYIILDRTALLFEDKRMNVLDKALQRVLLDEVNKTNKK